MPWREKSFDDLFLETRLRGFSVAIGGFAYADFVDHRFTPLSADDKNHGKTNVRLIIVQSLHFVNMNHNKEKKPQFNSARALADHREPPAPS
jgi:hypothetical protein